MWVKLIVITACVYLIVIELWLCLVSSSEEPPSSKRLGTMEDEGVEQLQPTALDLVEARVCETTTTGEAGQEHSCMCYGVHAHVLMYPNPNHTCVV